MIKKSQLRYFQLLIGTPLHIRELTSEKLVFSEGTFLRQFRKPMPLDPMELVI
jgi:hypothetical protein